MSTITKSLQGFIFNGAPLALASATFKLNLNSVSGFNAAGTSYVSYRPANTFNSLTQLQQDGVYIVDAKTPGFDIPGATLTAGLPAPTAGPLFFDSLVLQRTSNPTDKRWSLFFYPQSSDADDYAMSILITCFAPQYNQNGKPVISSGEINQTFQIIVPTSTSDAVLDLAIIDARGNIAKKSITLPAQP